MYIPLINKCSSPTCSVSASVSTNVSFDRVCLVQKRNRIVKVQEQSLQGKMSLDTVLPQDYSSMCPDVQTPSLISGVSDEKYNLSLFKNFK